VKPLSFLPTPLSAGNSYNQLHIDTAEIFTQVSSCFSYNPTTTEAQLTELGKQRFLQVLSSTIHIAPNPFKKAYTDPEFANYSFEITCSNLVECVLNCFLEQIAEVRLGGSAVRYVLDDEDNGPSFNDIDISIYLKPSACQQKLDLYKCLSALIRKLDPDHWIKKTDRKDMGELYIQKFLQCPDWTLVSVGVTNEKGKGIDFKFIFGDMREYIFDFDSQYLILNPVILHIINSVTTDKTSMLTEIAVPVGAYNGDVIGSFKDFKNKIFRTSSPEKVQRGGWVRANYLSSLKGYTSHEFKLKSFQPQFWRNNELAIALLNHNEKGQTDHYVAAVFSYVRKNLMDTLTTHRIGYSTDDQGAYLFQCWWMMKPLSTDELKQILPREHNFFKSQEEWTSLATRAQQVVSTVQSSLAKLITDNSYSNTLLESIKNSLLVVPVPLLKSYLKVCTELLSFAPATSMVFHNGKLHLRINHRAVQSDKIQTLLFPYFSKSILETFIALTTQHSDERIIWEQLNTIYSVILSYQEVETYTVKNFIQIDEQQLQSICKMPWHYSYHLACWLALRSDSLENNQNLKAFVTVIFPEALHACFSPGQKALLKKIFNERVLLPQELQYALKFSVSSEEQAIEMNVQHILTTYISSNSALSYDVVIFYYHYADYVDSYHKNSLRSCLRAFLCAQFPRLLYACQSNHERGVLIAAYSKCSKIDKGMLTSSLQINANNKSSIVEIAHKALTLYLNNDTNQIITTDFLESFIEYSQRYFDHDGKIYLEWQTTCLEFFINQKNWLSALKNLESFSFSRLDMLHNSVKLVDLLVKLYLNKAKELSAYVLNDCQLKIFEDVALFLLSDREPIDPQMKSYLLQTQQKNEINKLYVDSETGVALNQSAVGHAEKIYLYGIARALISSAIDYQQINKAFQFLVALDFKKVITNLGNRRSSLYLMIAEKLLKTGECFPLALLSIIKASKSMTISEAAAQCNLFKELARLPKQKKILDDVGIQICNAVDDSLNLHDILNVLIEHENYDKDLETDSISINLVELAEEHKLWSCYYEKFASYIKILVKERSLEPFQKTSNLQSSLQITGPSISANETILCLKFVLKQINELKKYKKEWRRDLYSRLFTLVIPIKWSNDKACLPSKIQLAQFIGSKGCRVFDFEQSIAIVESGETSGYFFGIETNLADLYTVILNKILLDLFMQKTSLQEGLQRIQLIVTKICDKGWTNYFTPGALSSIVVRSSQILLNANLYQQAYEFMTQIAAWNIWHDRIEEYQHLVKELVYGVESSPNDTFLLGKIVQNLSLPISSEDRIEYTASWLRKCCEINKVDEAFEIFSNFYKVLLAQNDPVLDKAEIVPKLRDCIHHRSGKATDQELEISEIVKSRWKTITNYFNWNRTFDPNHLDFEQEIICPFIISCLERSETIFSKFAWNYLKEYLTFTDVNNDLRSFWQDYIAEVVTTAIIKKRTELLKNIYDEVFEAKKTSSFINRWFSKISYFLLVRYTLDNYINFTVKHVGKKNSWEKPLKNVIHYLLTCDSTVDVQQHLPWLHENLPTYFRQIYFKVMDLLISTKKIEDLNLAFQLWFQRSDVLLSDSESYIKILDRMIYHHITWLNSNRSKTSIVNEIKVLFAKAIELHLFIGEETYRRDCLANILGYLIDTQETTLIQQVSQFLIEYNQNNPLLLNDEHWCDSQNFLLLSMAQKREISSYIEIFRFFSEQVKRADIKFPERFLHVMCSILANAPIFYGNYHIKACLRIICSDLDKRQEWLEHAEMRADLYIALIKRSVEEAIHFDAVQIMHAASLMEESIEKGIIEHCSDEDLGKSFTEVLRNLIGYNLETSLLKAVSLFNLILTKKNHLRLNPFYKVLLLSLADSLHAFVTTRDRPDTNFVQLQLFRRFRLAYIEVYLSFFGTQELNNHNFEEQFLTGLQFNIVSSIRRLPDIVREGLEPLLSEDFIVWNETKTKNDLRILWADDKLLDQILKSLKDYQTTNFSAFPALRLKCYKSLYKLLTNKSVKAAKCLVPCTEIIQVIDIPTVISEKAIIRSPTIFISDLSFLSEGKGIDLVKMSLTKVHQLVAQENWNDQALNVQKEALEFYEECTKVLNS
jgi:hypothetical protein